MKGTTIALTDAAVMRVAIKHHTHPNTVRLLAGMVEGAIEHRPSRRPASRAKHSEWSLI